MSETPPPSRRAAREARAASGSTPANTHGERTTQSAGDLADLFSGRATTEALGSPPPPPNRRRRRRAGWIALAIVVVLLGGLAGAGLWVWNTYEPQIRAIMGWEEPKDYEDGQATGEAQVTIHSGDTGAAISDTLYQSGVTKTSGAVYDYLVSTGQNPDFQPGVYQLQQKMTSAAAVKALLDPANKLSNTVQLREGLTLHDSLDEISETMSIPRAELDAAVADPAAFGVSATTLEGWIFPATYTFDPGTSAHDIIARMVARTEQALDSAAVPASDRQRILTIASIIEREARQTEDFYKVSRVIQNRLADDMKLEMDSTAQYGYGQLSDGSVSTSAEAQYNDNPWNTYVHTGLPVGPISNPGDLAIDAAMHPADGPWLYFVTVDQSTGQTVFSQTYEEHEQAVAQFQKWCSDHPGYSGC